MHHFSRLLVSHVLFSEAYSPASGLDCQRTVGAHKTEVSVGISIFNPTTRDI